MDNKEQVKLYLTPGLHRKIKALAALSGMSLSAWVEMRLWDDSAPPALYPSAGTSDMMLRVARYAGEQK